MRTRLGTWNRVLTGHRRWVEKLTLIIVIIHRDYSIAARLLGAGVVIKVEDKGVVGKRVHRNRFAFL